MITTFALTETQLQHMTDKQFGAFAAYCMTLANFHSITLTKSTVDVSFYFANQAQLLDGAKIQGQLVEALDAFANMEPFPCPCGCGAFISVSACLRQSGELVDKDSLTANERNTARTNKIVAIRDVRQRTGLGLRDAKDLVDRYLASVHDNY